MGFVSSGGCLGVRHRLQILAFRNEEKRHEPVPENERGLFTFSSHSHSQAQAHVFLGEGTMQNT